MLRKWSIAFLGVVITAAYAFAGDFPVVGATYQIDRARFNNQKIAICATEKAMAKYMEAHWAGDKATMRKMLYKIETMDDVDRMKKECGCTLISSFSQAKIVKKGVEAHQAKFFAFPFEPMWGFYLYFGGKVK